MKPLIFSIIFLITGCLSTDSQLPDKIYYQHVEACFQGTMTLNELRLHYKKVSYYNREELPLISQSEDLLQKRDKKTALALLKNSYNPYFADAGYHSYALKIWEKEGDDNMTFKHFMALTLFSELIESSGQGKGFESPMNVINQRELLAYLRFKGVVDYRIVTVKRHKEIFFVVKREDSPSLYFLEISE